MMSLPAIKTKRDEREVDEVILEYLRSYSVAREHVDILEAGCGWRWRFDLSDLPVTITGADLDAEALRIRQEVKKDLDKVICGDLTKLEFKEGQFDIIYSAYVLEHIVGARAVVDNIFKWLKPGGLFILKIPDRDSVYGLITRLTPHWVHIYYKKYLMGIKDAGKPGHGPYPTVHEQIIARKEFHDFVREHGLKVREEYCYGTLPAYQRLFTHIMSALTFGQLRATHHNMMLILEKPLEAGVANHDQTSIEHESVPA